MRPIFQAYSMIFILGNLVASQSSDRNIPAKIFSGRHFTAGDSSLQILPSSGFLGIHFLSLYSLKWNGPERHISNMHPLVLICSVFLCVLPGWKYAINTTIINFNNEKMQITWATRELFPSENVSFFYTFDEGKHKVWKSCTTYLLDQDYNSGCLFKTEGPTLAISIRNSKGSEELFSKNLKSDFYIKPNRPENVTFFWKEDTVTVSCNKPERAARCLRLELQYKSKFDEEWQSRTSKCCSVAEQGFDPRKCYSFRVRLGRLVPYCNVVNYTSDWEAETFWMNGTLLDSCDGDTTSQSNTVIVLSCLLAVLLMMLILLILLCKWQRVQMSILPAIPDPKYLFADLFNDHNGNLQEWLDKNDQVVLQTKLEYEEPESITEAESQQEEGKNSDKQEPLEKTFTFSGAAENNDVKAAEIACLKPTSNTMASFAGFHILRNDDSYVML